MTPTQSSQDLLLSLTRSPQSGKRRIVLLLAATAIALLLAGWLLFPVSNDAKNAGYVTEAVARGDLAVKVSATGNLYPTNQVDVGSELSGIVEAVLVDENDRVKHGQILARLDPSKLNDQVLKSQAAVLAAEAQVAQMQATVKESRAALGRLRRVAELSGGKVPSPSELESAEAAAVRAEANEANARAAAAQASATLRSDQTNLSKASIRSPIDGIVLTRKIEPGQTVAASLQAPVLFTLAEDLARMQLQVAVDEADVSQVKPGQTAYFTVDAWPGRQYPAEIERVGFGAQTTDGVVTYKTILKVSNSDLSLRPGMTATAEISTAKLNDVLLVPNAALRLQADTGEQTGRLRRLRRQSDAARSVTTQASQGQRHRHDTDRLDSAGQPADAGRNHHRLVRRALRASGGRRPEAGHGRDKRNAEVRKMKAESPHAGTDALITLAGITKTYGHGQAAFQALSGIDLAIRQGEFVAIMGPSGSGKSTAMNILGCLDTPTSGAYLFEGVHVEHLSRDQRALLRRHYLGFVFQGFNLLARTTAQENVELPLLYRGETAQARHELALGALRSVGLEEWAYHTSSELSGGQQQRVAIARAIVTNPKVLLADEPTGNLDSKRGHEIMELLVNMNREHGITILMVTHEPDIAAYAGRIVHFVDGKIARDAVNGETA